MIQEWEGLQCGNRQVLSIRTLLDKAFLKGSVVGHCPFTSLSVKWHSVCLPTPVSAPGLRVTFNNNFSKLSWIPGGKKTNWGFFKSKGKTEFLFIQPLPEKKGNLGRKLGWWVKDLQGAEVCVPQQKTLETRLGETVQPELPRPLKTSHCSVLD